MNILRAFATLILLLQEKPEFTGEQLIERLKDESTRPSAYYELARRAGEEESKTEAEFRQGHRSPELVVCPQGGQEAPIYVLLSDFLPRRAGPNDFGGGDEKLFKAAGPTSRKKEKLIEAFTAGGKSVKPWGGNNVVTDGLVYDLNGDGLVERADGCGYSLRKSGKSAAVLEVSVVREKAERIFAVVYNFITWGEWGYDFVDEDGDGRPEIQLGRKTLDGDVVPQVHFKWDPAKKTYVGPKGEAGDHFRVIDPSKIRKELDRLEGENAVFPPVKDRASLKKEPPAASGAVVPKEPSYAYVSLKGRPDEELFAFMGRGASATDRAAEARTHDPAGFWTCDPKAAALALVDVNRSKNHRSQVELAIDDRDGKGPGDTGVIRFTDESSRCYVAYDRHFLLQCDPQNSYLILASTEEGGVVAKERGEQGRSQDIRLCALDYKEARQLFQVIGWLDRIRSKSAAVGEDNGSFSTADGHGVLKVTFTGNQAPAPIDVDAHLWFDDIPVRWASLYTKDAYLNFVRYLLGTLAERRLSDRGTPVVELFDRAGERSIPKQVLEDQEKACLKVFELHLSDQTLMSEAMVYAACDLAGDLCLTAAAPFLEKLRDRGKDGGRPAEALRKIGAVKDPAVLEQLVLENGAKSAWALMQMKARFPDLYADTLEKQLRGLRGREAAGRLQELFKADASRARAFAAEVRPGDRSPLGRAALVVLRDGARTDHEEERVNSTLETALDIAEKDKDRAEAIDILVPASNPLRFPKPEIDAALEQILKAPLKKERFDYVPVHAAAALERRRGATHFDLVFARCRGSQEPMIAQELLNVLAAMAERAGEEQRRWLEEYLRGHLRETNFMMSEVCREIWAADFRSLGKDLERIATAGPDSLQSERADTAGGPVSPIAGKFHRARQVAQLWKEEDALTRAKLLVAMALHEAYCYVGDEHPELRRRFDKSLTAAAQELTAEQRKEVTAFASKFAPKSIASESGALAAIVRDALK